MFTILLFKFILCVDESLFNNGCLCSVKPEQCTPYCACDPFCTQAEKDSFQFTIPQKVTENNVACDTAHRIKKFRSKSVSTFKAAIEGDRPTCYYYQAKSKNSRFIKSYTPEDFGLYGFADAIKLDSPGIIIEVDNPLDDTTAPPSKPAIEYVSDGYLRGKPIDTSNSQFLFVNNDISMPVLFGVDSNYIFIFDTNNSNLDQAFNLSGKNIVNGRESQSTKIIYTGSKKNANITFINVFWTFFYQKRGSNEDYRFIIRKIKSEYTEPFVNDNYTTDVHIKFIELSADGESVFEAKEETLFSYSISRFFAIFGRDEDSLKSTGIVFCIGFLWTLWAYYSFFFSNN